MICPACGNSAALVVQSKVVNDVIMNLCDQCGGISSSNGYRDAGGNRISYPKDGQPFFSAALGKYVTGKPHFSELVKKAGLVQKPERISDKSMTKRVNLQERKELSRK